MIAAKATIMTGTAMAAFSPADSPPVARSLCNVVPSPVAVDVDAAPVVTVAAPVLDEDVAEPAADDMGALDADIAVDDGELSVEAGDASDESDFETATVDVARVEEVFLSLLLISDCKDDCKDARNELLPGPGSEVGRLGLFSLMAVNAAAIVEVTIPVRGVKGCEDNWRGSRCAMVNMCLGGGVSKDVRWPWRSKVERLGPR